MKKNFGLVRIVVLLLCLSFLVSAFNMSAFAIDAGRATYMEKVTPAGMPFSFVLDTYDSDHANVSVASQVTSASVTLNIIKAGTKEAILPQNGVYELEYGVKYNFCYRYTESGFDYKYNGKVFAESSTGGQPSVLVENAVLNYIESGYANNRGIDSAGTTNESESNNTQATADTTYNDYDNYGSISTASDVDYWKVTFTHGGKANFWLGNIPSGNDYELEIYDSTGSYVDGSYNSATLMNCCRG